MIKEFWQAFRAHSVMSEVEEEIREMLHKSRVLFEAGAGVFLTNKQSGIDIHERDREINEGVVEVRRKVVEHLSVSAPQNTTASLVFLKIINDIERIGDYAKNIADLTSSMPDPLPSVEAKRKLEALVPGISSMFGLAEKALFGGDAEAAHQVFDIHQRSRDTAGAVLAQMLSEPGVEAKHAVALALGARYLKRMSSHLKNVASTAVNSYSHLGYDKGKR